MATHSKGSYVAYRKPVGWNLTNKQLARKLRIAAELKDFWKGDDVRRSTP